MERLSHGSSCKGFSVSRCGEQSVVAEGKGEACRPCPPARFEPGTAQSFVLILPQENPASRSEGVEPLVAGCSLANTACSANSASLQGRMRKQPSSSCP